MKISVSDLRSMIKESIDEYNLKEGPYLDKIKAQTDKYRNKTDDILSQMRAIQPKPTTPTPGSSPTTPTSPTTDATDPAPGSDEDTQVDFNPLDNEDTQVNTDPEDMLQPDDPPAPSNDGSFQTLIDLPDADLQEVVETVAVLLPLAGIRDVRDAKFTKIATELAKYFVKKNNLKMERPPAGEDYSRTYMDLVDNLGWTSNTIMNEFMAEKSDWDEKMDYFQEVIGRVDPKTGFSRGLNNVFYNLGGSPFGAEYAGKRDNLKKAYPALLRITNSIGGSSASEKLKDILIILRYMAPEDVGREKEGVLSSFWNDVVKGDRYKEREAMMDAVD